MTIIIQIFFNYKNQKVNNHCVKLYSVLNKILRVCPCKKHSCANHKSTHIPTNKNYENFIKKRRYLCTVIIGHKFDRDPIPVRLI